MVITASECFFGTIIVFAVIGLIRGWRREIVSLVFVLSAVLLLILQGGIGVAQLIFVRLPIILPYIFTGKAGTAPPPPPAGTVNLTTFITFIVLVLAGYFIGNKAFPKPTAPAERFLGIIPAIIAGYAIITYTTSALATAPLVIGVNTPGTGLLGNYLLVVFLIMIFAVVAGLIAASAKKSSGGKKP